MIRTYVHSRLTTFAAAAGLAGVLAIAVPAVASASQFREADSRSNDAPIAAAPSEPPRICCFRWICWVC
jgi:hypothetical protein